MNIEVITDEQRLRQIGPAWHALWLQSGAGVFQAHNWIIAWWGQCQNHQLRIACAWQDDRLVAVLPLCVHRWHGIRVLEWAAQPVSDYCDVILAEPPFAMFLLMMWAKIEKLGGYDLVRLKHVHPNATVSKQLLRIVAIEEKNDVCLQVVREWPNGQAWYQTLNKKTRNNIARGGRILAEQGDIAFRQIGANEPRLPVIQRLLALKRLKEENRGSPLVRNDTMLPALVEALDQLGCLRIFVIEHAGTVIAGSINAMHHDKMLALFATYDPAYERASPGILLMTDYTRWAFDNAIVEVDYLLGAEPYKFKFANRETRLHLFVARRTLLGHLALAVYRRIRQPAQEFSIGSAYRTEKGTARSVVKSA